MPHNAQDGHPTVDKFSAQKVISVEAVKHWSRAILVAIGVQKAYGMNYTPVGWVSKWVDGHGVELASYVVEIVAIMNI